MADANKKTVTQEEMTTALSPITDRIDSLFKTVFHETGNVYNYNSRYYPIGTFEIEMSLNLESGTINIDTINITFNDNTTYYKHIFFTFIGNMFLYNKKFTEYPILEDAMFPSMPGKVILTCEYLYTLEIVTDNSNPNDGVGEYCNLTLPVSIKFV